MKELKMKCEVCGKEKVLRGKDLMEILPKIEECDWFDCPNHDHSDVMFYCPECKEIR